MNAPTPLEQFVRTAVQSRQVTIGLPASRCESERRFPLTPEAAAMLVERGFRVVMESHAADAIHYTDSAYTRRGIEIVKRAEALKADIVIYLPALLPDDAARLKRGALLMGFFRSDNIDTRTVDALLDKAVTTISLDRITDNGGNHPFADILHEIDGRAAIAIASSLLADSVHGKGILLGGVAGIVPCEVVILGAGLAATASAKAAFGQGATVRLFDNDIYALRETAMAIGQGVISSAFHPNVLMSALRSADVVIACPSRTSFQIDSDLVDEMKRGVITFDLDASVAHFPSMPAVDLAVASPCDNDMSGRARVCYINAGSAVPRTAAMALSNTLLTMFDDLVACDTAANALKIIPGLRCAAMTFLGKPVDADIARIAGKRQVDINLLLQFS